MTLPKLYDQLAPEARDALQQIRDLHEAGLKMINELMAAVVTDFEQEAGEGPTRRLRKYANQRARLYRRAANGVALIRSDCTSAWDAFGVPASSHPTVRNQESAS